MRFRIISLMLISVFLYNTVGYWVLFRLEQLELHREAGLKVRQNVSLEKLHFISIAKNEDHLLDWKREGREFRYKGTMYDVVHMAQDNDELLFYCIADHKETRLLAHAEEVARSQSQDKPLRGKRTTKLLKRFLMLRYLPSRPATFIPPAGIAVVFPDCRFNYPLIYKRPDTPPPWAIA